MARTPQTPEQKAARQAELAELNKNKRIYNKKDKTPEPSPTTTMSAPVDDTKKSADEIIASEKPTIEPVVTPVTADPAPAAEKPAEPAAPRRVFKPMAGRVKDREYSTPTIDHSMANTPIPEAPKAGANQSQDGAAKLNKPAQAPMPEQIAEKTGFQKLDSKEQRDAAALSAEVVLTGYDKLHEIAREKVKVKDETLITLHTQQKLDLRSIVVEAAHNEGQSLNVAQFFTDMNKQVDQTFVVSESFKDKVRPALERQAAKMGLGTSDGMYLALQFGMDLSIKFNMFLGFKRATKDVITALCDRHESVKLEAEAMSQSRMQQQTNVQQPQPQTKRAQFTEQHTHAEPEPRQEPQPEEKQEIAPEVTAEASEAVMEHTVTTKE